MTEKEHILSEIKRATLENGGVPIGSQRFFTVTGIRETDWVKHWARWGDALIEAGYAPNSWTSAYDEDFLLESLASLARELGRFPVMREISLKCRRSDFPSTSAFKNRLGGKKEMAVRLLKYCEGRDGFEDVAAMCVPVVNSSDTSESPTGAVSKTEVPLGTVYLLRMGRHWKIGHTNAFGRRERELAIQLPQKANVVHTIQTDDPAGIEGYWHRRFADRRANGEWFELTAEDISAFKKRRFM